MTYCRNQWILLVVAMQILRTMQIIGLTKGIWAGYNPCPDVFQYRDLDGIDYGVITVPNPYPKLAINISVAILFTAEVPEVIKEHQQNEYVK
jgi:hypothetical protein